MKHKAFPYKNLNRIDYNISHKNKPSKRISIMKSTALYITTLVVLLGFSGCTSKTELTKLRQQTIRQSILIQQQQQQIEALKARLDAKQLAKRLADQRAEQYAKERARERARERAKEQKSLRSHTGQRQKTIPKKPIQNIKLKKVEDTNYSSDYMYPDDKRAKNTQIARSTSTAISMNKTECIAMIGESKFERYTQMFGSEAAAIKRCAMIRAMQR